jgi:peptidoglycan-associated lipoprotein
MPDPSAEGPRRERLRAISERRHAGCSLRRHRKESPRPEPTPKAPFPARGGAFPVARDVSGINANPLDTEGRMTTRHTALLLCFLVGAPLLGCGKKKPPAAPTASAKPAPGAGTENELPAPPAPTPGGATATSEAGPGSFGPIYFEYDEAALSEESMATLKRLGEYLEANPAVRVVISGHADERGTEEYNLALGEERAKVAREFLLRYGIDGERVKIISYGEERPVEVGEDEVSYAKNRRGEFELSPTTASR